MAEQPPAPDSHDTARAMVEKQALQNVISVDPIVWHMDQWEIHALRGLVAAMLIEAQLYARTAKSPAAVALVERLISLKDNQFDRQLTELRAEVERDVGRHPPWLTP
jgi:hypothetical protein